jgi:multidrug efflux pump subunit AcrA (membrane-fusion protein)
MTITIGATGAVHSNQTASIPWQASGKVGMVKVEKGQLVEADQVLAELDPASLPQSLIQAQSELIAAKNNLEKVLTNSEARAAAHMALIKAQQDLDDAQKDSQSALYRRASQETIDIARANLITANEALDTAEAKWNQFSGLGPDSLVYAAALSEYARARQLQQQAQYNLNYVQDLPDPLKVEEMNASWNRPRPSCSPRKRNGSASRMGLTPPTSRPPRCA